MLPRDEIVFVAFAGWDAAGSAWFGYRTFWLNRSKAIEEHLDISHAVTGTQFDDLVKFLATGTPI